MTETFILRARPLTREAFAPYGDVIEMAGQASTSMNQGWGERFADLADIDVGADGTTALNLVRAQPQSTPVPLRLVERHPLGSQVFMPLGPQPFLVVVAPAGEVPQRHMLEAFISNGSQGVNYHRNIWHHPMIALQAVTDFVEIVRKGPGDNCDEADIPGGRVEVHL
ncbi:MAG TPA: ureidoglycolate lyase [Salinisphaeraceae bacterium]|nr:ureidoglycolate lyase [Salinisphaeraceae bacterium]